ncbi:MAG: hypothetical protein KF887_15395 [Paracoccaceae bacterium]|nr:MAG: hypothetical protein KF887_15395 [Paracoccaceae bacterium]
MAQPAPSRLNRFVPVFMSLYLIVTLAYRATVPGTEFPPRFYQMFSMGLDGAITLLLAAMLTGLAKGVRPEGGWSPVMRLLILAGVLAGIGLFGIRLSSDHGWWTGHYPPLVFD